MEELRSQLDTVKEPKEEKQPVAATTHRPEGQREIRCQKIFVEHFLCAGHSRC